MMSMRMGGGAGTGDWGLGTGDWGSERAELIERSLAPLPPAGEGLIQPSLEPGVPVDGHHAGFEIDRNDVIRLQERNHPLALAFRHQHVVGAGGEQVRDAARSEEHTSELQSLMRISYAVLCLQN